MLLMILMKAYVQMLLQCKFRLVSLKILLALLMFLTRKMATFEGDNGTNIEWQKFLAEYNDQVEELR